jgi:hypothetical protein
MGVNKARSHYLIRSINNLTGIFGNTSDFDDNVIFDTNVADVGWQTAAVDYLAILDY